MMMMTGETWSAMGSSLVFMSIFTVLQQLIPTILTDNISHLWSRLKNYFLPYMEIKFQEYDDFYYKSNEAYTAIELYLGSKSTAKAKRLKGKAREKNRSVVLSMDQYEEITDVFNGVKVKWLLVAYSQKIKSPWFQLPNLEKHYILTYSTKHRQMIINEYLKYVMEEGRVIQVNNRQRRLYTNNPSENWRDYKKNLWSYVAFDHPARFETLAIDPKLKEEIINDLDTFSSSKDYYAKIGKAWKRGYLLYGPPGTGKSSMIAAMANFLSYDVYDIELTAIQDNTELRKLLTNISSKSIIVIEDIDCSLDLTVKRNNKTHDEGMPLPLSDSEPVKKETEREHSESKVTLSGLLNFIDGLWSASGGERIIIFTTNHKDKLDPALIRRGRMDKHIELSYCRFEAFKVLAKNYLDIDSHTLFCKIDRLLTEVDMTPADVVEHLMPKTIEEDAHARLGRLVEALETAKEGKKKDNDSLGTLVETQETATEEAKQKQNKVQKKKSLNLDFAITRLRSKFRRTGCLKREHQ